MSSPRLLTAWRRGLTLTAAAALLALSACGGDDGKPKAPEGVAQSDFERQLREASTASEADFPATDGRTLQEIADTAKAGPRAGLATSVFTPGRNRLAFGVIDEQNAFVYGKSAVYVARSPDAEASGPYPAPADSLLTDPRFRSRTAASEKDPIAAIYEAEVPFRRTGDHYVLVVTKTDAGLVGAATGVKVARGSAIPEVGERPPAVDTETVESAAGNVESIDTRVPHAPELHRESFKDVLGKKPVALLFATPQLCQSRVCGPVVDVALQLQQRYGDRMEFIHQEVFVENDLNKGLRAPLREFGLRTEPWLFTVDAQGRVAARLEGSFGVRAFEQAVQAAL